jgi:uncharacterized protein (TIGR03790 family)
MLAALIPGAGHAEAPRPLGPDDIAVVFNSSVPASRELAEYYAQRRGVKRLIGLRLPERESIEREDYAPVVRELREALRGGGLADRVRCLVTFYGLPIRVGPIRPGSAQKELARELDKDLDDVRLQLQERAIAMEELARPPGAGGSTTAPATKAGEIDLKEMAERYQRAKSAIAERLERETDESRRNDLIRQFFAIVEEVEGTAGLMTQIRPRAGGGHPSALRRIEDLRAIVQESEARINELLRSAPDSPGRAEARRLIRRVRGLLGAAHYLQDDREGLLGHETAAAFDSELMLLWWDDYPLYRWEPNLLSWRVQSLPSLRQSVPADQWQRKMLMVSRLDGPTPAVVRRMIDDSIAAERTGLKGTFYIDARGIAKDNSYGSYDENLRELAAMMKTHTSWPTVLDDRPALFGPGQCPGTALYCGWYSLRKYVPAFTFVRGAVGYHIASAEAVSIRTRGEQGWCKRMLDDGIAATLGPVEEPYLHAFPLPKDFFGLLLTGRFTLAECYAFSNNFGSWMLMLLGDPLYRPFADHPVLKLEDAFEANLIPETYRTSATHPQSRSRGPAAARN